MKLSKNYFLTNATDEAAARFNGDINALNDSLNGLICEFVDYRGETEQVAIFKGKNEGDYRLCLAYEDHTGTHTQTKRFSSFRQALIQSRGYWAKTAIYDYSGGTRKQVIKWGS